MNPMLFALVWWQWMLAPHALSHPVRAGTGHGGAQVIDYHDHERARRRWQPWSEREAG